jgi:hypothetical protein
VAGWAQSVVPNGKESAATRPLMIRSLFATLIEPLPPIPNSYNLENKLVASLDLENKGLMDLGTENT